MFSLQSFDFSAESESAGLPRRTTSPFQALYFDPITVSSNAAADMSFSCHCGAISGIVSKHGQDEIPNPWLFLRIFQF